jgi:hypothetical protein
MGRIRLTASSQLSPVDDADNWLHFVPGIAMRALGVLLSKRDRDKRGHHDGR